MKKNWLLLILTALMLVLSGCLFDTEDDSDDNNTPQSQVPNSILSSQIKFIPDPGSPGLGNIEWSILYFKTSTTIEGVNNLGNAYQAMSFVYNKPTATVYYTNGGTEEYTFVSATRYKYKGTINGNVYNQEGTYQVGNFIPKACFWMSVSDQGNLKISLDGTEIGTLSSYFPSEPSFGANGTIAKDLSTGTHTVRAESEGGKYWVKTISAVMGTQEMVEFSSNNFTGYLKSEICFWTDIPNEGTITVYINGSTVGSLTQYFYAGEPSFGANGTLTVERNPGTYTIKSVSQTGVTRTSTVTLNAGEQKMYKITGSGSSTTKGKVCFWTNQQNGGTITIKLNGSYVGCLTQYFTSTPQFGQSGTLTVEKEAGTYSMYATDEDGGYWSSTITLSAGQQLLYGLNGKSMSVVKLAPGVYPIISIERIETPKLKQ